MSRYNDGVIFKSRCERVLLFQNFSLKNFYLRKHVGKKINFLLICVGEYKFFFFQTKTFSQGDNGAPAIILESFMGSFPFPQTICVHLLSAPFNGGFKNVYKGGH